MTLGVDIVKPSNNNSIVACFISWSQDKLLMKLLDTLLQMSERKFRAVVQASDSMTASM